MDIPVDDQRLLRDVEVLTTIVPARNEHHIESLDKIAAGAKYFSNRASHRRDPPLLRGVQAAINVRRYRNETPDNGHE